MEKLTKNNLPLVEQDKIVEENKGAVHSFVEKPEAEEYRDTLRIEKQMS